MAILAADGSSIVKEQTVKACLSQSLFVNETDGYVEANDDVYQLMQDLIKRYRHTIGHLLNVQIKILFKKKTSKKNGKKVLGRASVFPEKDMHFHPYTFLIELDKTYWQDCPDKREPLLFHELCHCWIGEDNKASIRPHDLEEFSEVVRFYGAWESDVKHFGEQLQLGLEFKEEAE